MSQTQHSPTSIPSSGPSLPPEPLTSAHAASCGPPAQGFQQLLSSLETQSFEAVGRPGRGNDLLLIHTYLTQRLNSDTAQNIVLNSVGATVDPLTELKTRTNFGRPDFFKLFRGMRNGILERTYLPDLRTDTKTHVGVYYCGPPIAARSVKNACKEVSCPEVKFKFWKEHF